ncbi:trifunctional transcriptional activator/DNA repair protein Ada/methylated-DNA--[protein]-cysteine S-methyltransferase [Magnetovibrio sp.]|uniref:bifunctional transcriptional activator/DNA repair enzyme AdaA n=1 Tax=Magnetovibrio sp. TaxID=2024836 RepID=UPI002F94B70A
MISDQERREYYRAFSHKNAAYEGVFYAGIKTTGIFCRPTCPARKAKLDNCEFFKSAQEALLAGYRQCKRCQPLSHPGEASELIKRLVDAVEAEPDKRWKDADFRALSVDASTVRRQFKKRFGMTFVAYARARRMGLALQNIRNGSSVIEAQLDVGYESDSGFRDAFSRIMGAAPSAGTHRALKAEWLDTPLGPMIAMCDDAALYLLEFVDRRGLEREIERLRKSQSAAIVPGRTAITDTLDAELKDYFSGTLSTFTIPLADIGSAFQKSVWAELKRIPYGTTWSYTDLAQSLGRPTAARAVAAANGRNQIAIVIPCHRVVNMDGQLGGYSGGIARKKWLIEHEARHA